MKNIIIFTAYQSLISLDRPVVNEIVKKFKSPVGSCISKRSVKLNAYKLFNRGFLFNEKNSFITIDSTCAVVCVEQPGGSRSPYSKTMVSNTPFRGRKRAGNVLRLITGDLHVKINTAGRAKIVGIAKGLQGLVAKLEKGQITNLIPFLLTAKTPHGGIYRLLPYTLKPLPSKGLLSIL